ncbi:Uncharacterised protein [Bordetella pertussis]|nr:Uncharacterised protein [Bordetella pertussis]CFP56462.1 Uncharacterised protein [Bordetella pertussis]
MTLGAVPSRKAIRVVIMMALASYETASVIHTTTAKARMASMRWPAGGSSAGSGSSSTTTMAMMPAIRPIGILTFGGDCGAGTAAGAVICFSG